MSTEREAVARAINAARKSTPWDGLGEFLQRIYLEMADAAIAALDAWRAGQAAVCHWEGGAGDYWQTCQEVVFMCGLGPPKVCTNCGKRVEVK